MGQYAEIFSPLRVRSVELANRAVVPALHQVRPILSPEGLAWHRRLVSGGAGLVIVERVAVSSFGKELTPEALKPLAEAIHSGGAAAVVQLWARRPGEKPDPDQLSLEQIEETIEDCGKAAAVCQQAGFEGVEPHGAHNTLLNEFFMPDKNHRRDEFGGTLDNRCRFGVRIVKQIRKVVGEELLILYRHTPIGDNYGLEDSLRLGQQLVEAGLDILDISPGAAFMVREGSVAGLAEPFNTELSIPVIAVGGMEDPEEAARALREGKCDLIAIGRQMIADPHWPEKVREGRLTKVIKCTKCGRGCWGNLEKYQPVECVQWAKDELAAYM